MTISSQPSSAERPPLLNGLSRTGDYVEKIGAGSNPLTLRVIATTQLLHTSPSCAGLWLFRIDDAPDAADHLPGGLPLLGKTDDLLNLIDELQPDIILVALNDMRRALPVEDLLERRLRALVLRGLGWPGREGGRGGQVEGYLSSMNAVSLQP
jgi:hypothetical protein